MFQGELGVEYKEKERKTAFWSSGREGGGKETPVSFRVVVNSALPAGLSSMVPAPPFLLDSHHSVALFALSAPPDLSSKSYFIPPTHFPPLPSFLPPCTMKSPVSRADLFSYLTSEHVVIGSGILDIPLALQGKM